MSDVTLSELLGRAADAAPPPTSGPPEWLEEAVATDQAGAEGPTRRWTHRLAAVAAVVVALAVGSAVLDDPAADRTDQVAVAPPSGAATGSGAGTSGSAAGSATAGPAAIPACQSCATGGAAVGVPAPAIAPGAGSAPAGSPAAAVPITPLVVHRGSMELSVDEGAFATTVERLTSLAVGLGGHVAATETAEQDDHPHGSVTVRVPAASYESFVAEVRRLGDVRAISTTGEDVTATYTDLEARLVALRATRDQLLLVLGEAVAIGDILAVQDRLNIVGIDIESLEGQRRLLEDQAGFGTLAVRIAEAGDTTTTASEPTGDGGISGAWDEAVRGFGDAVEWVVARSGKGLVLAALALAGLQGGRSLRRRTRRASL